MDSEANVVSKNLKRLMAENPHLGTLEKLSEASNVGYGTVRRARNGDGNSTRKTLEKLARAFKVPLEELTRDPDEPRDDSPVEELVRLIRRSSESGTLTNGAVEHLKGIVDVMNKKP